MAFKGVLVAAVCGVALAGCGGGSSSSSPVSKYNLSDYEGRTVGTDTLSGTWVMVATGNREENDGEGTIDYSFATKEYFVITKVGGRYQKSNCSFLFNDNISIDGDTVKIGAFVGKLTENKVMNGGIKHENYSGKTEVNQTIVKISNSTLPVAKLNVNANGQDVEKEVFCYQQSNAILKFDGESAKSKEIQTPYISLIRWNGNVDYTGVSSSTLDVDINFDTDYGDSVNFDLDINSSLSEVVNFNATDGRDSITGNIVVQLPAQ